METQNPQPSNTSNTSNTSNFEIKSLRLPTNYGATLGVKKLLTNVFVGKPNKNVFFRTHRSPDMACPVMILEIKQPTEYYVVTPDVANHCSELVRPTMLHAAIDRQNNVSLISVPLPGETGTRNQWHESLAQAVEHAKNKWIRIAANMSIQGYEISEAQAELPEPEWPEKSIEDLIEIAFRGRILSSTDHPYFNTIMGRI